MNGLDFLDKINDLDDDLLVLEKHAKVTNLRRRTTIISLCAAAGVFLVIGSILLIPRFMNKSSGQISSVRSGGTDKASEKLTAEVNEDSSEDLNMAYETTVSLDNDQEADMCNDDSDYDSQMASDTKSSTEADSEFGGGDVRIVNDDKNITDDEGYDYLSEAAESVGDSTYKFGDPNNGGIELSEDGFCFLDITDEPTIDLSLKYYLYYGEDSLISFVALSKNENDFKYQIYVYKWLDDLDKFLNEHMGEDVLFVIDGEDVYCIAPDNSYFSSNKKAELSSSADLYTIYNYDENTYHVS